MNIPFVSTIGLLLQTTHPKTSILGGSPKLRNSLPKGQVVLECEMPAGFFSFLGGTKKKQKRKKFCKCFTQGNALRAGCYTTLIIGSDLPMDGLH
jgi:hypothetical protein